MLLKNLCASPGVRSLLLFLLLSESLSPADAAAAAAPGAFAGEAPASGGAFMKPLQPSRELAEVVGAAPLPRSEAVSRMWAYIKKHKLQNEENKREIISDVKLAAIFDNKDKVSMFEMNKHLARHLK